jgi:hypothetical protein
VREFGRRDAGDVKAAGGSGSDRPHQNGRIAAWGKGSGNRGTGDESLSVKRDGADLSERRVAGGPISFPIFLFPSFALH